MRIGNYQLVVSFVVGVLLLSAAVTGLQQDAQEDPAPIQQTPSNGGLEVRDAIGQPEASSQFLQGSPSTQNPNSSQVQVPSEGLLQYLQPNSGQDNFGSQSSNLQ